MLPLVPTVPRPAGSDDSVPSDVSLPPGLRVSRMVVGTDELALFSVPIGVPMLPTELTKAQRAVGLALLAGKSNAQIASARGTSIRTVANQISSLLRKLNVRSRAEAEVALCRVRRAQDE
jgi:DNA-binding NarL/FixJ family response regulator